MQAGADVDTVAGGRTGMRLITGALGVELAVLLVTGVALLFVYRPTAAQSWGDVVDLGPSVTVALVVRRVHQWATLLVIPTAASLAVVVLARSLRGRDLGRWALAAGLAAVPVAAAFTGLLLPWDQLALWAVTIGTDMSGYRPLLGDEVRFVVVGGSEVGPGTILGWLAVHALVLGPLAGGLGLAAWRRVAR
ncbi:MAG TPA: cytochrome b N-terminal domain-containing protein [Acidimicrobiales bacterium]|nr:cytochrome b N-terminal domain-containing protein [Acidimicrobiales bacterium]